MLNPMNDPRHASLTAIACLVRMDTISLPYRPCHLASNVRTMEDRLYRFFVNAIKTWWNLALFLRLRSARFFFLAGLIALVIDLLTLVERHIAHLHRIAFAQSLSIIPFD